MSIKIVKGSISQALFVVASLSVSLIFTPYLLNRIGTEAFAYYPLSFNIINYASIITVIFTSVLSKFITVDYLDRNYDRMNEFFNASLYSNVIVGAVIGVPLLLVSFFIDRILDVPNYLVWQVRILFISVTLAFLVIQFKNTFIVANISTHRRYLTTLQKTMERLILISIPVVLFTFLTPSVAYLGVSALAAVSIRLFVTIKTQQRILPQLVIDKSYVKSSVVIAIISAGGWHAMHQLNTLLSTNVEILLANVLFGANVQSQYSLAVTLPRLAHSMILYITNALLPFLALLLKDGEQKQELCAYIPLFVKYMSVFMAVICAFLIGFGDVFLKLWIPNFYTDSMYIILILSSVSLMISGSFSVIYGVLVVFDKVKIPAIVIMGLGIINIPLSIFFARELGLGVYGILGASVLINTFQYVFFIPYTILRLTKVNMRSIYEHFGKSLCILISGIALCFTAKGLFAFQSFLSLSLAVPVILILLIAVIWARLIEKRDISFIMDIIKTKIEIGNDVNEIQGSDDDSLI